MAIFLRPDSNVTQTDFTNGYTNIDESIASDADFAYSTNNTAAVLEVGLSNPSGTPGSGTCTVRYRIAKTNAGTVDGSGNSLTVTGALYEGTTLIATDSARTPTGTWTGYSFTFNTSAVTDWNNLRIRFTTTATGGGPSVRRGAGISWAELETPDALEAHSGTMTGSGGGDVVVSAAKGGLLVFSEAGGGDATYSATTARSLALAESGGGDYTATTASTRTVVITATGGGDAVIDGDTDIPPELHSGSVTGSGGGDSVLSTAKGAIYALTETVGGDTTLVAASDRFYVLAESGGGDGTFASGTIESHTGSLTGSGGGDALLEAYKDATAFLEASGGGDATTTTTADHTTVFEASGGGDATLIASGDWDAPLVVRISMQVAGFATSVRSDTPSNGRSSGAVIRLGMDLNNE